MLTSNRPLYGDIHNHCGISYGHGPLADALSNAQERLDFVSITGHADWPDMPEPNPRIQHIVDFHLEDCETQAGDTYYARIRQKNDQWAWSSAIFCRD